MTCIIACKEEKSGKIWIGADDTGSNSIFKNRRLDKKVFHVKDMVFGYTSSYRMGQIIRFHCNPPKDTCKDPYKYMVKIFIPHLRKILKDNGYSEIHDNREEGGTFIVVYKGHIYKIYDDFQVAESVEEFASVGSGYEVAIGAMFANRDIPDLTAEERVLNGLRAASRFIVSVAEPFTIANNKNKKIKCYED